MTPLEFADALLGYCYASGASVTSWGRTEKRNRDVGGVEDSYHRDFLAADVIYDELKPIEFRGRHARRFGLKVVDEYASKGHDHLQPL